MLNDFIDINMLSNPELFLHYWLLAYYIIYKYTATLAYATYYTSQEIPDWNGVLALIRSLVPQLRVAANELEWLYVWRWSLQQKKDNHVTVKLAS